MLSLTSKRDLPVQTRMALVLPGAVNTDEELRPAVDAPEGRSGRTAADGPHLATGADAPHRRTVRGRARHGIILARAAPKPVRWVIRSITVYP